jgi:hypothetical protein
MKVATQQEEKIKDWMFTIVRDGGMERFDDFHIDKIDEGWGNRQRWIDGAVEAFRIAVRLRDQYFPSLITAAAFSLRDGRKPFGEPIFSRTSLEKRLDWIPPSLYLFREGSGPWQSADADSNSNYPPSTSTELDIARLFNPTFPNSTCFLFEFQPNGFKGFRRSVVLSHKR